MTMLAKNHPWIVEIVEDVLAYRGICYYSNLTTGEINLNSRNKFFLIESQLRNELFRKLQTYGDHCKKLREANRMGSFSWSMETPENIKQYCQCEPWQFPNFRKGFEKSFYGGDIQPQQLRRKKRWHMRHEIRKPNVTPSTINTRRKSRKSEPQNHQSTGASRP